MSVIENLKDAFRIAQKIGDFELYRRISKLEAENLGLLQENRRLRDEVKALREQSTIAPSLTFDGHSYWQTKEGRRDGPFCQVCWDVDRKLVLKAAAATKGTYFCAVCSQLRKS